MSNQDDHIGIKGWSEEDRPREKMLLNGYQALSNAELIAILIGSGTKNKSALDVARSLMREAGNNPHNLGKFSIANFQEISGVGEAKAITLAAALELGRRRKEADPDPKPKLSDSNTVYEYIYPYFADLKSEQFYLLLLDRANQIMARQEISRGGVSGTVVDPKNIFKVAIDYQALSLILCHNHPSGNTKPSEQDKELTYKIQQGGKNLDIKVLDHIIFADEGYFSFADEGLL